jgi:hypothetical protein
MDTKMVLTYSGVLGAPLVALVMHGATPQPACPGLQYCPEPEQRSPDMLERGSRGAPSLYGAQHMAITTNTAITTGTGSLGTFVSAAPQVVENVQSSVFRSV